MKVAMDECARIRDELALYAVGALDPAERAAVAHHLERCPSCREEAERVVATADSLAFALAAASPLHPPPELKGRVLQAVRDRRAAGDRPETADDTPGPGELAVVPPPAPPTRSSRRWLGNLGGRPVSGRLVGLGVAAVLAVVVVVALAWAASLQVALAREQSLRAEYATLVSQQEVVLDVVDSSKTSKIHLHAPNPASAAYGKLYTRPDRADVVVMASHLPHPSSGQDYHLWVTSAGQTTLAGVMPVNDQGFGLLVFQASRPGPTFDSVRLTLQNPGSAAPAGETILVGSPGP